MIGQPRRGLGAVGQDHVALGPCPPCPLVVEVIKAALVRPLQILDLAAHPIDLMRLVGGKPVTRLRNPFAHAVHANEKAFTTAGAPSPDSASE